MALFSKIKRHAFKSSFKHQAFATLQVVGFCLFAWGCQSIATSINSPIPGSVIGLATLLLLLSVKWLPEKWVNIGATWLVGELLLFFIPPVVAAVKYQALLAHYGAVLIAAMLTASTFVLVATAFTVDKLFKFESQRNLKRQQRATKAQIIPLQAHEKVTPQALFIDASATLTATPIAKEIPPVVSNNISNDESKAA
ncbi:hypothetical protein TUM4438_06410 [Shewanella sairae]|uniref:CidA/LrgA family protein n=1 Tax=Shewanella sairae TaxID=190310 RepID=A0ABQ4P2B4_9GAMM|nr:CidA/LrgA family protein [Shewanella sairae]MCL1128303.1 CidA/LrgA family protein [Shewanella sairae]GIU41660.1 hypothetical protein TUM4438_06410 [Shewanella sairae]